MPLRILCLVVASCVLLTTCHDRDLTGLERVAEVRLSVSADTLQLGDTIRLRASVLDSHGAPVSGVPVAWQSSDSSIVSVSADGLAAARSFGTATITARAGQTTASAILFVALTHSGVETTCSMKGTEHQGTLDSATWRPGNNPHVLTGSVTITTLIVEPGTLVCARPKTGLTVKTLKANGSGERRIVFTATDPVQAWPGITVGSALEGGSGEISHALIEYGGVVASYGVKLTVTDSHIRHGNIGAGGASFSTLDLRRTVIDTGNVSIGFGSRFEDDTIRAGGLTVAGRQGSGAAILNGGSIEDSPDIALAIGSIYDYRGPPVDVVKRPSIRRSHGPILQVPLEVFQTTWPTRADREELSDNVDHRVNLYSLSGQTGDLAVQAGLQWYLWVYVLPGLEARSLTMEPGASLRLGDRLTITDSLWLPGTDQNPITISSVPGCHATYATCGLTLGSSAVGHVSHVNFAEAYARLSTDKPVQVDHVHAVGPFLLGGAGSKVTDSSFRNDIYDWGGAEPALTLAGDHSRAERIAVRDSRGVGLSISGNDVQLTNCAVADNNGDGIQIGAVNNSLIRGCNIEHNAGMGISNTGGASVTARGNWWGDPAGPSGPNGDGVSGNVDASEPLQAPRGPFVQPVAVQLSAARTTVGTSDTLRVEGVIKDSAGTAIVADRLLWRTSDPSVAFIDPADPGLVVGARVGTVTVTALAASDTIVRATMQVNVTQAAPFYRWTRDTAAEALGRNLRITGVSPSNIWLADYDGTVHYDGTTWSIDGPTSSVYSIEAAPSGDVYAAAGSSLDTLWHWNGARWSSTQLSGHIVSLSPLSDGAAVIVLDSTVYEYRQGQLRQLFKSVLSLSGTSSTVWARSAADVYVGVNLNAYAWSYGAAVQHWDGKDVVAINGSPAADFLQGTASHTYTLGAQYVPGSASLRPARAYRYTGRQFEALPDPGFNGEVRAAQVLSDTFIVAASLPPDYGLGSKVVVYDGRTWWPVWTGMKIFINDLWFAGDEAWIVGFVQPFETVVLHGRRQP